MTRSGHNTCMYCIFIWQGDQRKSWGQLLHGLGCMHAFRMHCWELTTFYMYMQLYMVLVVSEHLLLLKRQLSRDLPTEKTLDIVFKSSG